MTIRQYKQDKLTEAGVLAGELVALEAGPLLLDEAFLPVCAVEDEKASRPRPVMKLSICNTQTQSQDQERMTEIYISIKLILGAVDLLFIVIIIIN